MTETPHVAVLLGGWSAERPVSLISGKFCADALEANGFQVSRIDVTRDIKTLLEKLDAAAPDAVLNMLHGPFGEDGTMQGLLELLELPYSHSGVLASSLAMDKNKTKEIAAVHGVPVPESQLLSRQDYLLQGIQIPAPYVAKPNAEGSSFGVYIVPQGANRCPLEDPEIWALGNADKQVLVEEYIPGRELTVAVMGGNAMTVTEIVPQTKFYDYEAKYADGGSKHILPADLPAEIFDAAIQHAEAVHKALGCQGVTRSDFRYNDTEEGRQGLFFLEINTQPGMTPTSLVPEQAAHLGLSFEELVVWMVEDALFRSIVKQGQSEGETNGESQKNNAKNSEEKQHA